MDKKYVQIALVTASVLLALYAQTAAQDKTFIRELKGFEEFILHQMEEWKVPGCAVAIVREGKIIFSKGFGVRDTQKESPVTSQTLFAIGSSTKAFTAVAMGILADEGKIVWDRPIRDFIPSFKLQDPYATDRVTMRDLLCHRTGLACHDVMWYGMGWVINPYRGHLMIHHGGGIDGFVSYICLLPRDNIGLAILTNLEGTPLVQVIAYNACARLLGLKPVAWNARFKNLLKQYRNMMANSQEENSSDRKAGTQTSHPLQGYEGDYENPGYGALTIKAEGNQLVAELNGIELPLKHYHYDVFEVGEVRFIVPLKGKKVLFIQDQKGDIAQVTLPLEPQVKDLVFHRVQEKHSMDRSLLEKFVGEYEISGMTFSISLREENTLMMTVPGQPEYELLPYKNLEF